MLNHFDLLLISVLALTQFGCSVEDDANRTTSSADQTAKGVIQNTFVIGDQALEVTVTEGEGLNLAKGGVKGAPADKPSNSADKQPAPPTTEQEPADAQAPTEDGDWQEGCRALFNDADQIVHITGNQQTREITADDVLAIKITGNQNKAMIQIAAKSVAGLDLNEPLPSLLPPETNDGTTTEPAATTTEVAATTTTAAPEPTPTPAPSDDNDVDAAAPRIKGICLFLAGNKAQAAITIKGSYVEFLGIRERGNQAHTDVTVLEGSTLANMVIDLKGNNPTVSLSGAGAFECPQPRSGVSCTK